jgi:N-acetylmuramoyl-L-alanine amidase
MLLGASGLAVAVSPGAINAQSTDFAVGDEVVVSDGPLNLRDDVGTDADVITVLEEGATATVSDGPEALDDFTWYEVEVDGGDTGWVAGDFLSLSDAPAGEFSAGDDVVVIDGNLNLRDDAGTDAEILDVMADGAAATVVSGPVSADDMDWYELDTVDYGSGWAAGDFLALADDEPSDDEFPDGAVLVVATGDGSNLNLREEPSTDGEIIDQLPEGTSVTVLFGPESADGIDWYEVDTDDFGSGWVAGEFLVYPASEIEVGDTVAVIDGTLNLRDEPGLDAEILDTLPDGTVLDVTDGPEEADGYTWFEVSNDDFGPGWVAADFLDIETEAADDSATETPTATATATATVTATATT